LVHFKGVFDFFCHFESDYKKIVLTHHPDRALRQHRGHVRRLQDSNFLVARSERKKKNQIIFWSKKRKNVKKQRFWTKKDTKNELSDLATRKFEQENQHDFARFVEGHVAIYFHGIF